MATFLTTARMDPALAARIAASVTGKKKKPGGPVLAPRLVSLVRVAVVFLAVGVVYSLLQVRHREKQEMTRTRAELLAAVRASASSLSESDQTALARSEASLVALSRAYDGEVVADELRAPGALASMLSRPTVYVRGTIGAFSSSRRIAEASTTSMKDALLLCLLEPPPSRTEKELLAKVHVAYAGGPIMEGRTANVHRLWDEEAGMPLLTPQWSARVLAVPDHELAKLRRDYDRAPIEGAKQAARASYLLAAMDEPPDGGGPTELDGERAHWVRVGLVDLAAEKVLLSVRRRVDPSWISAEKRPQYANGLDGCALGYDVHASVRTPQK